MRLSVLLLGSLLLVLPALAMAQDAQKDDGFLDVPKTHWAYEAVTELKTVDPDLLSVAETFYG